MKTDKEFTMRFTSSAYNKIIDTIGSQPAESGGLLFCDEQDQNYTVRKYVFDEGAKTTGTTYTFNTEYLNPIVKKLWEEDRLLCIGFIHSHPRGYGMPSPPDIHYFTEMFKHMRRELYLTPIVYTVPDGGFELRPYILRNGSSQPEYAKKIELYFDNTYEKFCGSPVYTYANFDSKYKHDRTQSPTKKGNPCSTQSETKKIEDTRKVRQEQTVNLRTAVVAQPKNTKNDGEADRKVEAKTVVTVKKYK